MLAEGRQLHALQEAGSWRRLERSVTTDGEGFLPSCSRGTGEFKFAVVTRKTNGEEVANRSLCLLNNMIYSVIFSG